MSFLRLASQSLRAARSPVTSQILRQSAVVRPSLTSIIRPFSVSTMKFQKQVEAESTPTAPSQAPDLTPLKLEGDLYAVIKVHNNPFLVTEGDKVILPYKLKQAQVGDVLNFHNVTTIGSRNYTFTDKLIDPSLYEIKAVVLEKTKLPMRVREITKRRQRKVRHAISKPDRTILRITKIELK